MVLAWLLTLPAAAIVGAVAAAVATKGDWGTLLVGVAIAIYLVSKRNPVDPNSIAEQQPEPIPAGVA